MKKPSKSSQAAKKKAAAGLVPPKITPGVVTSETAAPPATSDKGVKSSGEPKKALMGRLDNRLDALESINRFSEEYLANLMEEDLILDERVRQEMPSRLEALQRQLDRLEAESFGKQRAEMIAAGTGAAYEANDALLSAVNSRASQTEISLSTLKSRLGEMHQKLISKQQQQQGDQPDKAAMAPRKFAPFLDLDGEDDPEDLISDDYFACAQSGLDTDDYLDELDAAVLRSSFLDMQQIVSAARRDVEQTSKAVPADGEVQAILALFSAPGMSLEEKLQAVQPKLAALLQQDLYWRAQSDKATRQLHDLRMQKRLVDMELDRVRSINGRLEGFCKDLQSENRKIKLESAKVEEAMKTAIELTSEPAKPAPAASPQLSKKEKKKAAKKEGQKAAAPEKTFAPPDLPKREALASEPAPVLVDRLFVLHDLYEAREQHWSALAGLQEAETREHEGRVARQQLLLEQTMTKLQEGEARVNQLARSEAELKSQVRQYVEKFRQVEETLVKSNELFSTFRGEMEQMSVKLARFERENHQMQSKCQTLSRNIIEMADERTKLTASIETLKTQKAKLEQLCRTLQAERTASRSESVTPAVSGEEKPDLPCDETNSEQQPASS